MSSKLCQSYGLSLKHKFWTKFFKNETEIGAHSFLYIHRHGTVELILLSQFLKKLLCLCLFPWLSYKFCELSHIIPDNLTFCSNEPYLTLVLYVERFLVVYMKKSREFLNEKLVIVGKIKERNKTRYN